MSTTLFEDTVLPHFEAHRAEWLAQARAHARLLGLGGRTVTINDVRAKCPPPEDVDPRVMGAVFQAKDWELLRHERSSRKTCHSRPVGVFRLRGVVQ
ncbi:hypothetical protein [Roseomonas indoligenes]|uniref:Uncharacterized protein n=1 Tax=Roseomonas indoligenes TaxID=2820811 RepID=A0A940MYS7_9PROT|nr:hypothetical protein [Pararoseomonas indoligenes]MBP0492200.1 hypothetical protein [Pararoseomonas indoligenes]